MDGYGEVTQRWACERVLYTDRVQKDGNVVLIFTHACIHTSFKYVSTTYPIHKLGANLRSGAIICSSDDCGPPGAA